MNLTPRFQFGSIRGVISADFSLSRGTVPSVCSVTVLPNVQLDRAPKPMVWSDGRRSVTFRDCIVADVAPTVGSDGFTRAVVSIFDRRWRWRLSQISGRYNVRHANKLQEETQRTIQELAELCLKELGEKNYDIKAMPNDTFPHIDWDLTPVNAALDELCQLVNCHVSLTHDDRVVIAPDGYGKDIPQMPSSSRGVAFDFGVVPGKVGVTSAPSKWQLDFDLVPVGLDKDGQVKPIDELSYKPKGGWDNEEWPYLNVDKTYRKLAQETLWKWYLILPPGWVSKDKEGKFKIAAGDKGLKEMPGTKLKITSHRQFFPLLDHQLAYAKAPHVTRSDVKTGKVDPKILARKPAQIWGFFYDEQGRGTDNVDESKDFYLSEDDSDEYENNYHLVYQKGFTIDNERSVVVFADPVYRLIENRPGNQVKRAADIHLKVATHFYHPETRAAYRRTLTKAVPGAPDPKLVAWSGREDVVHEITYWRDKIIADNAKEVEKQLGYYLNYASKKYEIKTPASAHFPFLVPFSPDGLIAQVNYQINGEGYMTTSIYKQREEVTNIVSYDERRQAVQALATMEKLARLAGAQDDKRGSR